MKKTLILFFISQFLIIGQQTPGSVQHESILIENAVIHIGDGSIIEKGYVGFQDGKLNMSEKLNLKINMKNQLIQMDLIFIQDLLH